LLLEPAGVVSIAVSIAAPLLVTHSETDLRCAIEQAEDMFMTLRLLGQGGRACALPGREPRADALGIASPSRALRILLDWFDRYLKTA